MTKPYLSFPELPDGYVWTYDALSYKATSYSSDYIHDIDMCKAPDELSAEAVEETKYSGADLGTGSLAAWVTNRGYVRERSTALDAVTYATEVETMQDGIDLLVARAWLGMVGVKDA